MLITPMSLKRLLKYILLASIGSAILVVPLLLKTQPSQADNKIAWGVTYSKSQAEYLGLDPKETYSAIIHDLKTKNIKIHINWNTTEVENNRFDFSFLDWQVQEAERNNVNLILVIGMKTGRWPECHTPEWLEEVSPEERQAEIVRYTETLVTRYKDSSAVQYWQVENEPFLEFGTCPDWYYENNTELITKEIVTVRSLDPQRKIIVSESGELSDWTEAAVHADIVGVTLYRSTWGDTQETFGINPYSFLTPHYYSTKAAFIKQTYNKPVISIELQAEPWTAKSLTESKLEIQEQSMNLELLNENIEFAKQAKLEGYYFWGTEWWYWMKTRHNKPEIWDRAREHFIAEE